MSVFKLLKIGDLPETPGPVFPSELTRGIEPLARMAAEDLMLRLDGETKAPIREFKDSKKLSADLSAESTVQNLSEGKMFGVLVVRNPVGEIGYLSAYSGKLDGQWCVEGFVPPPFDTTDVEHLLTKADRDLKQLETRIAETERSSAYRDSLIERERLQAEFNSQVKELVQQHRIKKQQRAESRLHIKTAGKTDAHSNKLIAKLAKESQTDKQQRKNLRRGFQKELQRLDTTIEENVSNIEELRIRKQKLSRQIQEKYFSLFNLCSADGSPVSLVTDKNGPLPPSGTGECAAPKLLSFAFQHGYQPITGTEFWWGDSPPGKIRHHRAYYTPCHSKCRSLLPRMLSTNVESEFSGENLQVRQTDVLQKPAITIVYEDSQFAVVSKPAGYLSVPGKSDQESLLDWASATWPGATGPLLVHRLDMDTSGLVLIALNKQVHKQLQKQFIQRSVRKTYIALVAGSLRKRVGQEEGVISLPLRVDLDDRPRQMVCPQYGRPAQTRWQVLEETEMPAGQTASRLLLQPITGRTHQLRVHLASPFGLNSPILGDPLYAPQNALSETGDSIGIAKSTHKAKDDCPARAWINWRVSRMMLHAEGLDFIHPVSQEEQAISHAAPF